MNRSTGERITEVLVDGVSNIAQQTTKFVSKSYFKVRHALDTMQPDDTGPELRRELESQAEEIGEMIDRAQETGELFCAIDEKERRAIEVHVTTSDHPDTILRRAGLIEQKSVFGGEQVYFNARFQQWRLCSTDKVADVGAKKSVTGSDRRDSVPQCLIQIVGSVPTPFPAKTKGAEEKKGNAVTAIEQRFTAERKATRGADPSQSMPPHLQHKLIIQYLARAVPAAAQNSHAMIVMENNVMADYVGVGINSNQVLRTQSTEELPIKAVTFTRFCLPSLEKSGGEEISENEQSPESFALSSQARQVAAQAVQTPAARLKEKEMQFCALGRARNEVAPLTHNVVVYRSVINMRSFLCQGWKPTAFEGKLMCGSCYGSEEDHVPRYVLRGYGTGVPVTPEPFQREVDMVISRCIDHLASGYKEEFDYVGRTHVAAPERSSLPVCILVIGGDTLTCKHYLAQCVRRRYKLIIIEGAGGYADMLFAVKRRVDITFPNCGRDELRKFATALDPLTAEIINASELLRFIPIGTKNEELIREIEGALRGDRALLNAWKTYATWQFNADEQRFYFVLTQSILQFLQLITTFLTVLQTYLLLQFQTSGQVVPAVIPEDANEAGENARTAWTLMKWSIVLLPIVSSLLQALTNKLAQNAKWTELRSSAERLLSEIYQYRCNTGLYKPEEIERHRVPFKNQRVYTSKEDLLQQKAHELTEALLAGRCKAHALLPYKGSLPPKEINYFSETYDDGLSALTPDQYVRVRLRNVFGQYKEKSKDANNYVSWLRFGIYLFSALGTGLAAIAAYSTGTIQAWVAFTTAVVNAFTKALETSRWEFLHKKYNSAIMQLCNINAWWASLGCRADTKEHRDLLVSQVEAIVQDEVNVWAQQIASAMDKSEKGHTTQERKTIDKSKVEQDNSKLALQELGFEELAPERVVAALADPFQMEDTAEDTLKRIEELRSKILVNPALEEEKKRKQLLDQVKEKAAAQCQQIIESQKQAGEHMQAASELEFGGLFSNETIPPSFSTRIHDKSIREAFLRALLGKEFDNQPNEGAQHAARAKAKRVNFCHIMRAAIAVGISDDLMKVSHNKVLHLCKTMVTEYLFDSFLAMKTHCNVRLRLDHFVPSREKIEEFISEMANLSEDGNVEKMQISGIINMIQDSTLRGSLLALRKVFPNPNELILKMLNHAQKVLSHSNPVFTLFHRMLNQCAELDTDDIMEDPVVALHVASGTEEKLRKELKLWLLPKSDLLAIFPLSVRSKLVPVSQRQIARYLGCVFRRKPTLGAIMSFAEEFREVVPLPLQELLGSKELQLRFVTSVESVSAQDILQLNKSSLLRKMKVSPAFTTKVETLLGKLQEPMMRFVLCCLQGKNSNTFVAETVDRVADAVTSFDLRSIVDFENAGRLVAKLDVLRMADLSLPLSKVELMRLIGFRRLALQLDVLSDIQIRSLLAHVKDAASFGWSSLAYFEQAVSQCRDIVGVGSKYEKLSMMWTAERVLRMIWLASSFSRLLLADTERGLSYILAIVGDEMISSSFRGMDSESFSRFIVALKDSVIDPEIANLFEFVVSRSHYTRENDAIIIHDCRDAAVRQIIVSVFPHIQKNEKILLASNEEFKEQVSKLIEEMALLKGHAEVQATLPQRKIDGRLILAELPPKTYKDFVTNLYTFLTLTAPLRFFYRVVKQCRFVDLRGLFFEIGASSGVRGTDVSCLL